MARPALTDEQRREIRRSIRDAAAKLYLEDGLDSVSARAVAEQAGVSVGTLYSYFGSLSELMQSLWRQPAKRLTKELEELASEISNPVDRLRGLLKAYVDFSAQERLVFRAAFLFVRPESLSAPAQVELARDRFFQIFRQAISDGQKDGSFRSGDTDEITQMVISCVHGTIALPINLHRLALDASDCIPMQAIDAQLEWLALVN